MAIDDCLADLGDAGDDGIAREVAFNRGDGCFLDVAWGGEVRLTCAEVHQFHALGAQFCGFCGDRHGGRNLNATDAIGEDLAGVRGECWVGCGRGGRGAHGCIVSDFSQGAKES